MKIRILLLLMIFPGFAVAAPYPAGYPSSFNGVGVVQEINLNKEYIVVSDAKYKLNDNVTVNKRSGTGYSLSYLRVGDTVGLGILKKEEKVIRTMQRQLEIKEGQAIPTGARLVASSGGSGGKSKYIITEKENTKSQTVIVREKKEVTIEVGYVYKIWVLDKNAPLIPLPAR